MSLQTPVVPMADTDSHSSDPVHKASGAPVDATAELMAEVDRLVKSHRTELHHCVERWLQTIQEPQSYPHPFQPVLKEATTLPLTMHKPRQATVDLATSSKSGSDLQQPHVVTNPSAVLGRMKAHSGTDDTIRQVTALKRRVAPRSKRLIDLFPRSTISSTETVLRQSQTWLMRITSSRYYEWASGTLICLNAIFIGWQTQHVARYAEAAAAENRPLEQGTPDSFLALQVVFTLLFSVELGLRWVCDGLVVFFQDKDRWWNVLDVTVVAFSVVDLLMHFAVKQGDVLGNFSVLRVLRVIRIVRVARVIRIMRFFRELRMMIFSILRSMKSLLWVILVLGVTFYVFGITFTVATSETLDTAAKWRSPSTLSLRLYFGTLDRSILSLFMAMSGGNDWFNFYDALEHLPVQYRVLFLIYISFAIFAVVNIVTGVFVESAMQSTHEDRDITVHEELENKKVYLKSMREIFEEMDDDDTGSITIDEFEAKLDDERVIAYFNAMKLDVSDARRLFWLIDYDQSGEVDIDEFLTGCYRLQGESRSLDMKLMQCEVRFLRESFVIVFEKLARIDAALGGPKEDLEQGTSSLRVVPW